MQVVATGQCILVITGDIQPDAALPGAGCAGRMTKPAGALPSRRCSARSAAVQQALVIRPFRRSGRQRVDGHVGPARTSDDLLSRRWSPTTRWAAATPRGLQPGDPIRRGLSYAPVHSIASRKQVHPHCRCADAHDAVPQVRGADVRGTRQGWRGIDPRRLSTARPCSSAASGATSKPLAASRPAFRARAVRPATDELQTYAADMRP